jgi:hypothetical protein
MGYSELEPTFREQKLNSKDILCALTDKDLREIGISALGQRKKIIQEVQKLSGATRTYHFFRTAPYLISVSSLYTNASDASAATGIATPSAATWHPHQLQFIAVRLPDSA